MAESGVDRGGLSYKIEIADDFTKGLKNFRELVAASRRSVRNLRDDIKKLKKARDELKGVSSGTASANKAAESSSRKTKKTIDAEISSTERLVRVRRRLEGQLKNLKVKATDPRSKELRKQILLEKQVLKTQDLKTQAINKQIVAQRRLGQVIKQVATAQDKTALATNKDVQKAKLLATLAERRAIAERKIAVAKNNSLTKLNAAVRAEQAIARFKEKQLQFERLAAFARQKGLTNNLQALRDLGISRARGESLGLVSAPTKPQLTRIQKASKFFGDLNKRMRASDVTGNRISFTFRRLFGILAAFAIARQGITLFVGLVKEMVNFNSQLEQATLGIGALITAVSDIRDSNGNEIADPMVRLNLAQVEARRQVALLRKDALRTVATFEQLRDAFQTALAPGLQAGLNIDEVRNFAVRISQAAAAIGLSQEQLAEEIRSILSGTIRTRTTRIAVALGIDNADIERMKEAGTLSEFLEKRFLAFAVAGEEALGTFNAIFTNLRDGLSLVLGAGGIEFFESLKDILQDIKSQIIDKDELGIPRPSSDAISAVEEISDGLVFALEQARELGDELAFEDIQSVGKALGSTIKTVVIAIRPVIKGILDSLGAINLFFDTINAIFGAGPVRKTLEIITQLLITSILINTVWLLVAKTVAIVLTIHKGILFISALIKVQVLATYGIFLLLIGVALNLIAIMSDKRPGDELERQKKAAQSMQDIFRRMGPILIRNRRTLEEQSEVIKKLKDDMQSAVDSLAEFDAVRGLSGGAEKSAKNIADAKVDLREESLELVKQEKEAIAGLAAAEGRLSFLREKERKGLSITDEGLRGLVESQREFNRLSLEREELLAGVSKRQALGEQISEREAAIEKNRLATLSTLLRQLEEQKKRALQATRKDSLAAISGLDILAGRTTGRTHDAEGAAEIDQFIEDMVQALGKQEAQLNKLREIDADRIYLIKRRLKITIQENRLFAKQSADRLTANAAILELQNKQKQALAELDRKSPADDAQRALIIEESRLAIAKERQRIAEKEREANIRALSKQFARNFGSELAVPGASTGLVDFERTLEQIQKIETKLQGIESGAIKATGQRVDQLNATLSKLFNQLIQDNDKLAELMQEVNQQESFTTSSPQAATALDFMKEINAVIKDNQLAKEEENLELAKSEEIIRRWLAAIDTPVLEGFRQGLRDLALETPSEFEQAIELMKDSVRDFSSFAASSLVDAFSGENVDVLEGFRQLLLGIAEQVLEVVIQRFLVEQLLSTFLNTTLQATNLQVGISTTGLQAAASAVSFASGSLSNAAGFTLGASTKLTTAAGAASFAAQNMTAAAFAMEKAAIAMAAASASGGGGGLIGAAGGGHVASLMRAKGLAAGGPSLSAIRPGGLDPKDTVPAWLDPREWVIRGRSVALYGHRTMDAINRGLIDPFALEALAGVRGALRSPTRSHTRGLAAGGQVSTATPTVSDAESSPRVVGAVLAATNDAARVLLDGGSQAVLEFLEDNGFRRDDGG